MLTWRGDTCGVIGHYYPTSSGLDNISSGCPKEAVRAARLSEGTQNYPGVVVIPRESVIRSRGNRVPVTAGPKLIEFAARSASAACYRRPTPELSASGKPRRSWPSCSSRTATIPAFMSATVTRSGSRTTPKRRKVPIASARSRISSRLNRRRHFLPFRAIFRR